MAVDQASISFEGINDQGTMISWRDFTSMGDKEKRQILNHAGFTADEGNQLLDLLAKNQNITWVGQGGGSFPHDVASWLDTGKWGDTRRWTDPGYATLEQQLQNQTIAQQQQQDAAARQQQLTGADPAAAKPAAAAPATQVNAPISTAALNDYVKSFVMPLMQNYQTLVNGDMAQWGGMINNLKKETAGSDVNFATPNLQLLGQLQNLYGQSSMLNQVLSPYFNMVNATIGQDVKIGMAKEALGSSEALLQQQAATSPMLQQVLQQSGVGTLGAASNILGQITGTNPQTQANKPAGT